MTDDYTHSVVNFLVDESVAVVPVTWLNQDDTRCYYPSKATKSLNKAVRKSQAFEGDWTNYAVRVLQKFDSYKAARLFLPQSTITSDLDTGKATTHMQQSGDPCTLPKHPMEQEDIGNILIFDEIESGELALGMNAPNHELQESAVVPIVSHNTSSVPESCSVIGMNAPIPYVGDTIQYVVAATPIDESVAEFRKDVLQKLQNIEIALKHQSELLGKLLENQHRHEPRSESTYEFRSNFFPISEVDKVDELENLLTINKDAFTKLLMRTEMLSDDVLAAHCYKGQSKKRSFSSYIKIQHAMISAMGKNSKLKGFATKEVLADQIPKCLKRASDRVKMREKNVARRAIDATTPPPPSLSLRTPILD